MTTPRIIEALSTWNFSNKEESRIEGSVGRRSPWPLKAFLIANENCEAGEQGCPMPLEHLCASFVSISYAHSHSTIFPGVYHIWIFCKVAYPFLFFSDELSPELASGRYNTQVSSCSVHSFQAPRIEIMMNAHGPVTVWLLKSAKLNFYCIYADINLGSTIVLFGPRCRWSLVNVPNLTTPYRTRNPTPSADFLPFTDTLGRQGRFPLASRFPTPPSDEQAFDHERSLGASYSTFRLLNLP